MEIWLLILGSLFLSFLLNLLLFRRRDSSLPLPPDPNFFPFLGSLQWLRQGLDGFNNYVRSVHHRLGPIITLRITSRPAIFVADGSLAHQALVLNGAVFADRPPAAPISKIVSSNQHTISSCIYGATWRLLRRNLTSEILHPSRVRSYSHARRWVLEILFDRFRKNGSEEPILVLDHLYYAMFALLVLMCFGDKLDEKQIKEVKYVQTLQRLGFTRFNILNLWPKFTKLILRKRWEEFFQMRRELQDVLLPLIRARRKIVEERKKRSLEEEDNKEYVQSYVDTLLDVELPDEKRKLNEDEIVSLCSEFLTGGTDTTATALQWIMANLVKNQEIQERLYEEITSVVGGEAKEVEEEDAQKIPYLKAVVMEGLRRHPPGNTVLPHSVTEDTVLGGYKVPKKGTINFLVAEIGRDPKVWEEPMAFKPERFMGEEEPVDITGSKGIKMMPFGAGRRICPGIGLAMLHLEYYVANMVREFQWKEVEGHEVDLTEKLEFTTVMKHPLKALAVPRRSN
ncbi:Cytochrome P450 [Arabidopsis thaliana x Arabidopsis arenosa]|uniref:Cytochrome P450 n=1 Tax=Arabidopsis thaliana x Arabidopsis arenosa TaxID=1240361 RepID=A0A8T2BIP0_9BRAS|nr:Cytochrome P450 [Arabidopsis thaliana x Arabidopsis arenosa]